MASGDPRGNRTHNLLIKSQLLYLVELAGRGEDNRPGPARRTRERRFQEEPVRRVPRALPEHPRDLNIQAGLDLPGQIVVAIRLHGELNELFRG